MADSCCRNIATKLRATCLAQKPPGRACPALKPRQAAEPPLSRYMCYILHAKPLNSHSPASLLYVLYVLYLTRQAAEPPLSPASLLYVLYVLYLTRQAAEPPLSPGSLLYVLYVLYLTRQAAEPPLSPSSLLYVLYVLYTLYARNLYYICYIGPYSTYSTYSKEPGESGCSVACLVRYSTYSTYSKDAGESGCSAGWHSVRAAFCMVFAWFLHVEQLARFFA